MPFNVPRAQIPWHPTVDLAKCVGCGTCFEFCAHGTYGWDEKEGKPLVKNPNNCVVGCSGCAPECPAGAITFPPLTILKQYMRHK
jgi:NAD-dependent dihydropyrimidine dehydrogenase PreA subunit